MTGTGTGGNGCLTTVLSLLGLGGKRGVSPGEDIPVGPDRLPYRLRDDFLSSAELSFYKVLLLATRGQFAVFTKVNLLDVFFVARPSENQSYRNRISAKHLDFLLCSPETMRPLLGIELDDRTHRATDRQERDSFVDAVFAAAGLPLTRIEARYAYDVQGVAAVVARLAGSGGQQSKLVTTTVPAADRRTASPPVCAKCGVPMVKRTAGRGDHEGETFFGCPNYPRCREIVRRNA